MKPATGSSEAIVGLGPIASGVALAAIVMLSGSLFLALVLHFTTVSEQVLPVAATVTAGLSVFIAGAHAGKRSGRAGWLHGGVAGTAFALLAWAVAGPAAGLAATALGLLQRICLSFALGIAGGVFGVNL